jgi:Cdc6-like AAA superfamily ATPase
VSPSRRNTLMGAFRPAQEVDDPDFFAGRMEQICTLVDALHVPGSCPLIYGDRGLGKTSLAVQMKFIAMGDDELLRTNGLGDRVLEEDEQFLCFFVTCTDATKDVNGLLQLLINAAEEADFSEVAKSGKAKVLIERTTSRKISLKAFEAESIRRYAREKSAPSYQMLSLPEKLTKITQILVDSYNMPVLFIVDELDRLTRTRGLASYIKAASNFAVKFMLVGIASNISSLLSDHLSLERSLVPVRVPRMNEGELYEIVEKADSYLAANGLEVKFDHFATLKLVEYAAGFPWFVHVIGLSALLYAVDQKRSEVVESDVTFAIHEITRNQFAQQFSDTYMDCVRNSYQREVVLRAFAEWPPVDIPTSEIYRLLKTWLDVPNPSVYKGHLASKEYGSVIFTPQFQHRSTVRFSNEMFKVYVRLRPSIYDKTDKRVAEAFRSHIL